MLTHKVSRRDYDNILVGSDFHLQHNREFVWGARGHNDVVAHEMYIRTHLRALGSRDLLVYVGDYALNTTLDFVRETLAEIKAKVIMVWGNHNAGIKQLYKEALAAKGLSNCELYPLEIAPNVQMLGDQFVLQVDRRSYHVQHMAPMIWDKQAYGVPAIIGHSHSRLTGAGPFDNEIGKVLDVGVDNALIYNQTPFFSIEEIDKIMETKNVREWDYHGSTEPFVEKIKS